MKDLSNLRGTLLNRFDNHDDNIDPLVLTTDPRDRLKCHYPFSTDVSKQTKEIRPSRHEDLGWRSKVRSEVFGKSN